MIKSYSLFPVSLNVSDSRNIEIMNCGVMII